MNYLGSLTQTNKKMMEYLKKKRSFTKFHTLSTYYQELPMKKENAQDFQNYLTILERQLKITCLEPKF